MSKKFTGITSAGSAIPVYDKDAHSALQNKADVSALTAYQEKGDYYSASNPSGFLTAVPAGYATSGDLEDLSTAIAETFQPQSAMTAYLTAVPEGYATVEDVESAISGKQDISGMSAYQSRGDMSSYASKAFVNENYYSKTLSDNRYQAQSSMSAYQPVGSYLSASESANFYPMTGNPSGFLTEHQSLDGLMQTSGLEYDGDKISGYMGSAFAGGGEVPEGVMVESAVGYNAVNEISGYNGSAIAQYGAEKQWLVHDDTLVHAANSAQYALGVNLSAVAQLLGVDETVLWENSIGATSGTFSENLSNFNTVKVLYVWNPGTNNKAKYVELQAVPQVFSYLDNGKAGSTYNWFSWGSWDITESGFNLLVAYQAVGNLDATASVNASRFYKVIGIGRKQ